MKRLTAISLAAGLALGTLGPATAADVPPAPNGIEFPAGYQDWAVLAVSHRTDNNTIRVILGNDEAIAAARAGKTNPWPDGAVIGKVVWKAAPGHDWPGAVVPGPLVHAEFMFKDAEKYAATYGWGWARWTGMDQKPHGDANAHQACIACHTPVKGNDWVFTRPAPLPAVAK